MNKLKSLARKGAEAVEKLAKHIRLKLSYAKACIKGTVDRVRVCVVHRCGGIMPYEEKIHIVERTPIRKTYNAEVVEDMVNLLDAPPGMDGDIKREIAKKIVDGLMKDGMVYFTRRNDDLNNMVFFRGTVSVLVPPPGGWEVGS